MFHLVSLSLQISLTDLPGSCLGLCVCVACFVVFVGLVVGFFLWGKFDLNHRLIPVVDRPCLALGPAMQEKKLGLGGYQNPTTPFVRKESLLLLSQWIRLPRDDLHIRHATSSLKLTSVIMKTLQRSTQTQT